MSYDYSLFLAPGPGPMSSWPAEMPGSLGSVEELKNKLAACCPHIQWTQAQGTWFGQWEEGALQAEFQMTAEADGSVRFLTLRRTEREQVERLSRALGCVAVDPQRMELHSPATGDWSPAG